MKLVDKVAVVNGIENDIGRATARLLAAEGAQVVLIDDHQTAGESLKLELEQADLKGTYYWADVKEPNHTKSVIAEVIRRFGHIDILVNNLIPSLSMGALVEVSDQQWLDCIDTVLTGQFLCSKYVSEQMKRQRGGSIVFISSVLAQRAIPQGILYSTVANGTLGLMRCFATDLGGYGIRVNGLCPSIWDDLDGNDEEFAGLHLLNRLCTPEEIARSVLYLAGEDSSFVTAETICVDGGLHIF